MRKFIIEIEVDEEELRENMQDKETSICDIIVQEMGWVEQSGITLISTKEA